MKKIIITIILLSPIITNASVITSQNYSPFTSFNNDDYAFKLYIGKGITSTNFQYVTIPIEHVQDGEFMITLKQCTNSNYTTCDKYFPRLIDDSTYSYTTINSTSTQLTSNYQYYIKCNNPDCSPIGYTWYSSTSTPITIDETKYIEIDINPSISQHIKIKGNSATTTDLYNDIIYCEGISDTTSNCEPAIGPAYMLYEEENDISGNWQISTSTIGLDLTNAKAFCDEHFTTGGFLDIANNLCLLFGYAFIPSTSSVNNFSNLPNILQNKFPFSYFYSVYSVITNLTQATSTSQFPELKLSTGASSSIPLTVTIFSSSTITQYAGSSNITLFKSLMEYVMWIIFGTMVFFTIKNLIKS